MSISRNCRQVLLLCCSVTAMAGVIGATPMSGALAGHGADHGLSKKNATEVTTSSDIDQLRNLAALQRKQIVAQRKALGISSSLEAFRAEYEPLPSDSAALHALIERQQRQIESDDHRLVQPVETASKKLTATEEPSKPTVVTTATRNPLASHAAVAMELDDSVLLPARLAEQDRAAREAFDLALAKTRREQAERAHVQQIAPAGDHQTLVAADRTPTAVARPEGHVKLDATLAQWRTPHAMASDGQGVGGYSIVAEATPTRAPEADHVSWLADSLPRTAALADYETPAADTTPEQESLASEVTVVDTIVVTPTEREERLTEVAQAYYGSETVPDEELDEIRAGFVTSNGLVINIGIEFETLINGELVVQNIIDLNDGGIDPAGLATVITSPDGGTTQIVNTVGGAGGVATNITNSASDIVIEQVNTITIQIPNHAQVFDTVGGGLVFSRGLTLPQTYIDMSVGAIAQ